MIEVEPEMKRRLYAALAISGSTLKDWFLQAAAEFCEDAEQPRLFPRDDTRGEPASAPWILNDKSANT